MTTSKFINMPSRELKKGLKSVIRKSNEDQRAIIEQCRQITEKNRVNK
jgi:hypothetical protein